MKDFKATKKYQNQRRNDENGNAGLCTACKCWRLDNFLKIPDVNYHNFEAGLFVYNTICSMHFLCHKDLHRFAKLATACVASDVFAIEAMAWMNKKLYRHSHNFRYGAVTFPAEWKKNRMWSPVLSTHFGYELLHKSYHMFDNMKCPSPPHKHLCRNLSFEQRQKDVWHPACETREDIISRCGRSTGL